MINTQKDNPLETVELSLTGMHCASCATRIEKALGEAPAVADAAVNFATSRATVKFDPTATGVEKFRESVRSRGQGGRGAHAGTAKTKREEKTQR